MRGCEVSKYMVNNSINPSYLSPWGVVSPDYWPVFFRFSLLFIPMRGCEFDHSATDDLSLVVIYPHEGLWVASVKGLMHPDPRYLSPWGVVRWQVKELKRPVKSYLSPWGVVRSRRWPIAPWMKPVIYPHEGLWGWRCAADSEGGNGYLSPWGVVRVNISLIVLPIYALFIPMRSCETRTMRLIERQADVIYPHEGLWDPRGRGQGGRLWVIYPHEGLWEYLRVCYGFNGFKLFIPMRGCEMYHYFPNDTWKRVIYPHEGLWDANKRKNWDGP